MNHKANRLALLVGSNPLPNYIAAIVLEPREVVLLFSPETEGPRDHLRTAFQKRDSTITINEVCIDDATDVRKIRDACQSLRVDHLHYSGGTKPMAAHAHRSFQLEESQASYLDERKGLLRFDDGYDVALSSCNLGLTLDLVLTLYGAERTDSTTNVDGGPTATDVESISRHVLSEPEFAQRLYDHFRPNGKTRGITEARNQIWRPADHGIDLSVTCVPDTDWSRTRYKSWDSFLSGRWLEQWTRGLIQPCTDASVGVEMGIICRRQQPVVTEFEIDIALIRGHRLYVVSCTTDSKKVRCKSKLFEVAMRARQMGGDLARSALVCLLDRGNDKGAYVEQLRSDIGAVWDAPNIPHVFGLADLREWAGTSDEPNLSTLKEWLDP